MAGLFASLSIIAFTIENLIPPIFIPGAKLGFSNVFILLTLILVSPLHAYGVLITKCLLGSLLTGNISAVIYSIPAGLISLTAEWLLFRTNKFSIVAISVVSSVINVIVQNAVFCLYLNAFEYFIYLPYLALISVLAGFTVGVIVNFTLRYFPNNHIL